MTMSLKTALKQNIVRFRADAPENWAGEVFYLSGDKSGKPVSARAIRYAGDERNASQPTLALVEALAAYFGCIPAELLVDWEHDREILMDRIMSRDRDKVQRPKQIARTKRPSTETA
jgi:hypothetical protein